MHYVLRNGSIKNIETELIRCSLYEHMFRVTFPPGYVMKLCQKKSSSLYVLPSLILVGGWKKKVSSFSVFLYNMVIDKVVTGNEECL